MAGMLRPARPSQDCLLWIAGDPAQHHPSMPDLAATCAAIRPVDHAWRARAAARIDQLTMPHRALGRLCDLAIDLAGITRSLTPSVARSVVVTMAADHGVCAEGVSAYPQAVTAQMVRNIVAGGAGISVLARAAGARVVVADLGVAADLRDLVAAGLVVDAKVGPGTANLAHGPAMTRDQATAAVLAGLTIATAQAARADVLATGEMGIGNTTAATAIVAGCTGMDPDQLTGTGTGIAEPVRRRKAALIRQALAREQPHAGDGLGMLAAVGGFEIAGIAGLCLGAALHQRPVVVDGFISTAGALIAQTLCPAVSGYLICAHRSAEPGHAAMLHHLGATPLLDLGLRLGEGTGAALALPLLTAARAILCDMATFADAGVSTAGA
jgi:nicotinate-nucleotide--dimethylbenzimidazole phosphoribosyltransferase